MDMTVANSTSLSPAIQLLLLQMLQMTKNCSNLNQMLCDPIMQDLEVERKMHMRVTEKLEKVETELAEAERKFQTERKSIVELKQVCNADREKLVQLEIQVEMLKTENVRCLKAGVQTKELKNEEEGKQCNNNQSSLNQINRLEEQIKRLDNDILQEKKNIADFQHVMNRNKNKILDLQSRLVTETTLRYEQEEEIKRLKRQSAELEENLKLEQKVTLNIGENLLKERERYVALLQEFNNSTDYLILQIEIEKKKCMDNKFSQCNSTRDKVLRHQISDLQKLMTDLSNELKLEQIQNKKFQEQITLQEVLHKELQDNYDQAKKRYEKAEENLLTERQHVGELEQDIMKEKNALKQCQENQESGINHYENFQDTREINGEWKLQEELKKQIRAEEEEKRKCQTQLNNYTNDKGPCLNSLDGEGYSLLHRAVIVGNLQRVEVLVGLGSRVDMKDMNFGSTALDLAAGYGYEDIAKLLILAGADVDVKNSAGGTPLHAAAWYGHTKMAQTLIEYGADISAKGDDGRTALHCAAHQGNLDILLMLVKKGANPKSMDKWGKTPFDWAISQNQILAGNSLAGVSEILPNI